ncbi:MAG: secretin and TonB N-terminal domain-containing protein, partial [Candidatus Omnitrophota bacterium]|nr:secretin and TonB N-terminal domain-containing protein [Candidatus Omnitrophota bacterium]
KSGVNIVATPEVMGNVTIRLVDVPWDKALEVILKTYGLGYDRVGNIITVAPLEKLTALKKQEVELAQVQPMITEVFNLKYIDAQDAKKSLEPQLSARGKITVLEMTGQVGWEFTQVTKGESMGKRERMAKETKGRSTVLIISDVPPVLDKIKEVIDKIDIMPQQILIEARIMEVNEDTLRDIGFDWGTGSAGASTSSTAPTDINLSRSNKNSLAGRNLASEFTPSIFGPKEGTTTFPGTYPYKAGLELLYKKLTGAQFEVILHALDQDVDTNTLSAPRIMALNNQEASILVGTKYPILRTETTGAGSTAVSNITLDYYQDIGIQLNVVPQVSTGNYINMVIHPAVTSYTTTLGTNSYPIIEVREAETRILMKDGETVVIGGLLKDVKNKELIGIPILNKIPLLGFLFNREITDTQKIDLLIFITARIVKEGEFTTQEIAKLETRLDRGPQAEKAVNKNKKKRIRQ